MRRPPRVALNAPASRHGTLTRLQALSEAVRKHQRATKGRSVPKRPADHALYSRLAEIESSLVVRGESNGSDASDVVSNGHRAIRYPFRGH